MLCAVFTTKNFSIFPHLDFNWLIELATSIMLTWQFLWANQNRIREKWGKFW